MIIPMGKLAETLGGTLDQTCRAVKISLFNGVIRDTRFDTGRLKGNWQTSTGQSKGGELDREDKEGISPMAEVKATVKGDTVDYLTNNLPYAEVYENIDGMIAKNVARLDRTVREITK